MPRPALLAVAAVAAALAGGCSKDFAPFNRLTSLRVLAIQAEPPLPFTGDTATLKAYVAVVPGRAAPTYSWSWCPFPGMMNDGYVCRVDEQMLRGAPGGDTIPP